MVDVICGDKLKALQKTLFFNACTHMHEPARGLLQKMVRQNCTHSRSYTRGSERHVNESLLLGCHKVVASCQLFEIRNHCPGNDLGWLPWSASSSITFSQFPGTRRTAPRPLQYKLQWPTTFPTAALLM